MKMTRFQAFLRGVGSILDIGGTLDPSRRWSRTRPASDADAEALASDWEAVAADLAMVTETFVRCRCGELRQIGARGWRLGTCEDGEPHWQCPGCAKQGTEPQPT